MSDEVGVRSPGSGLLVRARRAGGPALAAVLLPAGGHVLAGGSPPPLPLLVLLAAALWALLIAAPARRTGPSAVLALASAASAGQVVVHWAATAAHEHPLPVGNGPMLLAHLAAAAVTVAVVLHGEAALAATTRLLARALDALRPDLATSPVPDARAPRPTGSSDCVRAGRVLAVARPRRGPPERTRSLPSPR